MGDIVLNCSNGRPLTYGSQIPQAKITLTLNTQVTSRVLDGDSGASEALLLIDEPGSTFLIGYGPSLPQIPCATPLTGCTEYVGNVGANVGVPVTAPGGKAAAPNVFQGVVSGNTITFYGVPILPPATTGSRIYRITNVRANANPIPPNPGGIPGTITGAIAFSPFSAVTLTEPFDVVAFVQPSFSTSLRNAANNGAASANFSQCGTAAFGASGAVGILRFAENYPTAFKTRTAIVNGNNAPTSAFTGQDIPGQVYNSESGFTLAGVRNGVAVAGLADWGTRLKAVFTNVPSGVTIYVSNINVSSLGVGTPQNPAAAGLVTGEIAADGNNAVASYTNTFGSVPYAPLSVVNGTGTAVWEVWGNNYTSNQNFDFGVILAYNGTPAPGTISVNLSLAPNPTSGAFSSSNAANPAQVGLLPRFADTSTVMMLATIASCQTPALTVSETHVGDFIQGQNGRYSVTVANSAGAASTSGLVTVTETVPSWLTLVSMSGAGWTCPSGSLICSRIDSLAAGASYPPVTVTVFTSQGAPSQVSNPVSVSGGGSDTATATDTTNVDPAPTALRFVPVAPCRVVDTRKTNGSFGGPSIPGGTKRDFYLPFSFCGVPFGAGAYSLNVAVAPSGPLGYLTVWPQGQAQPVASTLNSADGRAKSNAAIVPAGSGGAISVFASNTTDVILDINGYFIPASDSTALAFFPVTPCRVADTRKAFGPLGGPSLLGGHSRTFPIQSACGIPPTAQAYSLNLAAVPPAPLGYIRAWATGQSQPAVASLNDPTGTGTANAAIVQAGTNGSIDIFASNPTDLVIDINGYFAPMATGGLSLYTITPCRELDTRKPAGTPAFTGEKDVAVGTGPCSLSSAAQAYVFGAAVVPSTSLGFLTLWPQGQTRPQVATLNAVDGAITSNMAIVPTANGSISAWATNATQLILDIFGYFAQ